MDVPFTYPFARSFDVTSSTGLDYRISVGFPLSYGSSGRRYPALYVLDADNWFGTVLEYARESAMAGESGEVVVVGIAYPGGHDPSYQTARRTYDFSTAEWDLTSSLARQAIGVFDVIGQEFRIGGAPAFLDFLVDELQPAIHERYLVDSDDRAILGHSAGGNFVGHALFSRPESFTKYISACPGFAFNDWDVFRLEERYAALHDDLPVTLYLAAGSDEALQFSNTGIVSGTARLAETLKERRYPSLRLVCEILSGKTHITAYPEVLQRGLVLCWPGSPYDWSAERVAENFETLGRSS
jgi:predicted alpha/beta superfamily hydrolase